MPHTNSNASSADPPAPRPMTRRDWLGAALGGGLFGLAYAWVERKTGWMESLASPFSDRLVDAIGPALSAALAWGLLVVGWVAVFFWFRARGGRAR